MEDKILHLSQDEIIALKKAIIYLKFSCTQADSVLFAGSPLINRVLDKLIQQDDFGEQEKLFYAKKNDLHKAFLISKLEQLDKDEGISTTDEIKLKTLKECLHPYPME